MPMSNTRTTFTPPGSVIVSTSPTRMERPDLDMRRPFTLSLPPPTIFAAIARVLKKRACQSHLSRRRVGCGSGGIAAKTTHLRQPGHAPISAALALDLPHQGGAHRLHAREFQDVALKALERMRQKEKPVDQRRHT